MERRSIHVLKTVKAKVRLEIPDVEKMVWAHEGDCALDVHSSDGEIHDDVAIEACGELLCANCVFNKDNLVLALTGGQ